MQVKMLRGLAVGASAVLGLALVASSARAQAQTAGTRFGVEAALGTNNNVGIGVGAFVKFHLAEMSEHPITGRGRRSTTSSRARSTSRLRLQLQVLRDRAPTACSTSPRQRQHQAVCRRRLDLRAFVGLGNAATATSTASTAAASASNTGLHIVGGLNFMANSKLMPFVEAKIELSSGSEFIIKAGIHF